MLRRRKLLIASDIVVIATMCLLAALHHPTWRWSLVVWGIVVGLVSVSMMELSFFIGMRTLDVPTARRETLRQRQPVYIANAITFGLVLGIGSAIVNRVGIDIAGAVLLVFSQVVGVVLAVQIVRARRRAGE